MYKQLIGYNDGAGTGSSNNYAYLVTDDKSKDAVIIDPAHPPEYVSMSHYMVLKIVLTRFDRVAPVLKEQVDSGMINLTAIINTHQ